VSILVALTPELSGRSLDAVRGLLREQGLSVSGDADLIDKPRPGAAGAEAVPPVLTDLLREMQNHDAVVVTLSDAGQWSGLLDGFLGADFRLMACLDEPPDSTLAFSATDVVVDLKPGARSGLEYAVTTLVGDGDLRPDKYEHALFIAQGQASRSAGLRGGVGCALIDGVGDAIALGTNEVPRAGGGQYWTDSPDDARDLHNGVDPAWEAKMALVRSVLEYTEGDQGRSLGDLGSLAERFLRDSGGQGGGQGRRPSRDGTAQTLESLGRVVHAELAALAAASRHGAAVVGSEAVVTRSPCRQCLRQLIVTGVSAVRFLGHADAARYPFHADAITTDGATPDKVLVAPFSGVTPRGYDKAFGAGRARPVALGSALVKAAGESPASSCIPLAALLGTLAGALIDPARP
jgi:deoxycytidylate deaminase